MEQYIHTCTLPRLEQYVHETLFRGNGASVEKKEFVQDSANMTIRASMFFYK